MPRNKEYDRNEVLEKSMKVFWQKGFEGTSMQDLVDATRLNRYSMYEAFGSKEGLFLEALDRYRDDVMTKVTEVLKAKPKGLQSIKNFFAQLIELFSRPKGIRGCLMTNTAIDLPLRDQESEKKVNRHIKRMERLFHDCLVNAVERGEVDPKSDLKATARYLVVTILGFGVLARVTSNRKHFESVVEVALSILSTKVSKMREVNVEPF